MRNFRHTNQIMIATQGVNGVRSHAERGNQVAIHDAAGNAFCGVPRLLAEPERQGPRSPQRFVVSVAIFLTCTGCTQDADSYSQSLQHEQKTLVENDNQPTEAKPSEVEQQYDGLTLTEWRERIKNLDPDDPDAAQAVTGLMEIVADNDAPWFSRRQAAQTLGRIGPAAREAIPLLIKLLDEPGAGEGNTSFWAAKALALFDSEAKAAAPALIKRLQNRKLQPAERQVTLDALSRIGTADPTVLPAFIAIVSSEDEEPELRMLTAESLAYLGSRAVGAVPALLRVTESENEPLRRAVVMALGAVGPLADVAVPTLAELLVFDESAAVRDQAADALAQIGTPAVALLTRLLADEDAEVRWRAARSLGQIRPTAKTAVSAMTKLINDADDNVRMHALESLWAMQADVEVLIPASLEEFINADRQIRIRAFRLLVSMGERAQTALDRLKELAEDDRPYVRQTALKALDALENAKTRP